jgi:hypothetical protein
MGRKTPEKPVSIGRGMIPRVTLTLDNGVVLPHDENTHPKSTDTLKKTVNTDRVFLHAITTLDGPRWIALLSSRNSAASSWARR